MEKEVEWHLPEPLLAMRGVRSRVSSTVAFTLRSRVSERFSKGDSINGPLTAHPALFTSTSTYRTKSDKTETHLVMFCSIILNLCRKDQRKQKI